MLDVRALPLPDSAHYRAACRTAISAHLATYQQSILVEDVNQALARVYRAGAEAAGRGSTLSGRRVLEGLDALLPVWSQPVPQPPGEVLSLAFLAGWHCEHPAIA